MIESTKNQILSKDKHISHDDGVSFDSQINLKINTNFVTTSHTNFSDGDRQCPLIQDCDGIQLQHLFLLYQQLQQQQQQQCQQKADLFKLQMAIVANETNCMGYLDHSDQYEGTLKQKLLLFSDKENSSLATNLPNCQIEAKKRVVLECSSDETSWKLNKKMRTQQIAGWIYQLAKDASGCRLLQRQLEIGSPLCIDQIFKGTMKSLFVLMIDPSGNYLCQKLLAIISNDQLALIIEKVLPDIKQISLNIHGTRALQALIERAQYTEYVPHITNALHKDILTLIKDVNGNHVVQKCIDSFPFPNNQFIYDELVAKCREIATHRHGCRVIQKAMDAASIKQRQAIIDKIEMHALELVQDAFGNYVVQYVLNFKQKEMNDAIIRRLSGHFFQLSKQKFASNVIEKCLVMGSSKSKDLIVWELLLGGPVCVRDLLLDPFGNYVVQRVLQISSDWHFSQLIEVIQASLPQLEQTANGKRVALKLLKKYPIIAEGLQDSRSSTLIDLSSRQQVLQKMRLKRLSTYRPTFYPNREEANLADELGLGYSLAQSDSSPSSSSDVATCHFGLNKLGVPRFSSSHLLHCYPSINGSLQSVAYRGPIPFEKQA